MGDDDRNDNDMTMLRLSAEKSNIDGEYQERPLSCSGSVISDGDDDDDSSKDDNGSDENDSYDDDTINDNGEIKHNQRHHRGWK